jgi:tryptophan halogenase
MSSGEVIIGDYFIDCSGFKRVVGKKCELDWTPVKTITGHNSALITSNGYSNIDDLISNFNTYTSISAKKLGWTFKVPLLDKVSYGYVFNDEVCSVDELLEEVDKDSNKNTRLVEPFLIKWEPGYYSESSQFNFSLIGLSSGFIEPFDANSIYNQTGQIDRIIEFINSGKQSLLNRNNKNIVNSNNSIVSRIDLTFGLSPRDDTDYWKRIHSMVDQDKLKESMLDEIRNEAHSVRSQFARMPNKLDFLLWPVHIYYYYSLYYGIDLTPVIKYIEPRLLDFTKEFCINEGKMNRLRALMYPTIIEWLEANGVDINSLLNQDSTIPTS